MCGIVGYVGNENASEVLLDGLRRLEYRGYDSAGMVVLDGKALSIRRSVGKLAALEAVLRREPLSGSMGIGHTRWATHGRPTEENAHPHRDASGRVAVVHNGIIENYPVLKANLRERGCVFTSQTDTEAVVHLIAEVLKGKNPKDGPRAFADGVMEALKEVRGAYALGIVSADYPDVVIGARKECPLIVGVGDGEYFLASDIPAILNRTRRVVFMEDGELAILTKTGYEILKIATGEVVTKKVTNVTWDAIQAEKSGYRHFMLKEIHEQPRAIEDTLLGRYDVDDFSVYLDNVHLTTDEVRGFRKAVIVACGTSWHAALIGKYLIESWVKAPVWVDIASEFRYRDPLVGPTDLFIAVSQSGETADTIAAMRYAKEKGAKVLSICNVVGSTMAREAHGRLMTRCGPEIGVASTKAFTAQITMLTLLALNGGVMRGTLSPAQAKEIMNDLLHLSHWISDALKLEKQVQEIARKFHHATNFLFLGRNLNYPIALEGALKLKEISYIHAEGYPSGELKHGPIALIDSTMPVVAIATESAVYEKVISNVEEVKARGGRIILLATEGDERARGLTEDVLFLPHVPEFLSPSVNVVPLQLLAYHIAILRGCDVDQPRNLAKSVTVE
jgi:glucosamine--fructose-6-phosphate aminotransferase (isomerizing)